MKKSIIVPILFLATFLVPNLTYSQLNDSSGYCFSRNLYSGLKSDDVIYLQTFLTNQKLLNVAPTGFYYKLTFEAVKSFQKMNGLEASGFFGPKSRDLANRLGKCTSVITSKFLVNDSVRTTAKLNTRSTPSGMLAGTQLSGTIGTIVMGPVTANGFNWWKVDYNTGTDGWSVENYLMKITTPLNVITSATSTQTTPPSNGNSHPTSSSGTSQSVSPPKEVSIFKFGAVGNGIADDTTAVQNAFNAPGAETIICESGMFLIGEIIVPPGIKVIKGPCILKMKSSSVQAGLLRVPQTNGLTVDGITLRGLGGQPRFLRKSAFMSLVADRLESRISPVRCFVLFVSN